MIGKRGMVEGGARREDREGHSIQASLTLWQGHSHRIGAPASSLQEKKERVFSWDCLCFFPALSFLSRNFHLLCVGGNLLGSTGARVQVNFTGKEELISVSGFFLEAIGSRSEHVKSQAGRGVAAVGCSLPPLPCPTQRPCSVNKYVSTLP